MKGPRPLRRPAQALAAASLDDDLDRIAAMAIDQLRVVWRETRGQGPPAALSKDLIARALAYQIQEDRLGGLAPKLRKLLAAVARNGGALSRRLKVGSIIVREHQRTTHEVMVVPDGYRWQGQTYSSLSAIALNITGTHWNGPRFFGLRREDKPSTPEEGSRVSPQSRGSGDGRRGGA